MRPGGRTACRWMPDPHAAPSSCDDERWMILLSWQAEIETSGLSATCPSWTARSVENVTLRNVTLRNVILRNVILTRRRIKVVSRFQRSTRCTDATAGWPAVFAETAFALPGKPAMAEWSARLSRACSWSTGGSSSGREFPLSIAGQPLPDEVFAG